MAEITTCAVLARIWDSEGGEAVAGAIISAELKSYDIDNGFVSPHRFRAVTDVNGECTLELWPNELGSRGTYYDVTIESGIGKAYRVNAVVPNTPTALLHLISELAPYPGKPDGTAQLAVILAAQAVVLAARDVASAAAVSADADAQQTAADRVQTGADRTAAAASAVTAGQGATTATTKAGEASASAAAAASTLAGAVKTVDLAAPTGLNLAGFTASGLGAAVQNALDKMRNATIHIADYGGLMDGSDTGPALAAAIVAATSPVTVGGFYKHTRMIDFGLGDYYFSTEINLKQIVHLRGQDSGMPGGYGTRFLFPAGSNGVIFNSYNTNGNLGTVTPTTGADGSTLERITVQQVGYSRRFGSILDVNGSKFVTSHDSPQKFAPGDSLVVPSNNQDRTTVGVVSAVTITSRTLGFSAVPGVFTDGEVVTGSVSGATGVVAYVGLQTQAVCLTGITGTFVVGDVVTGGTSGATGTVSIINAFAFPVYTLSSSAGTLWVPGNVAIRAVDIGSGIIMRARGRIVNCQAIGWPENGVRIIANVGATAGNANCSDIDVLRISGCGLDGFLASGGDANAGKFIGINSTGNGGWGVRDASFLGNHYFSCHTSINSTGAYYTGGVNNFSAMIGCYSEGLYQLQPFRVPTSQFGGYTTVIGGDHGAGFANADNGLDRANARRGYGGFIGGLMLKSGTGFEYDGDSGQNSGALKMAGAGATPDVVTLRNAGNRSVGYGPRVAFRLPQAGANAPHRADYSNTIQGGDIAIQWESFQGSGFNVRLMPKKNGGTTDTITVTGGGATRNAAIWPTIVGGVITALNITDAGAGYTSAPTIAGTGLWAGVVATGKVFNGELREVVLTSSPTGLTNTASIAALNLTTLYLNPGATATQSLGTAAVRWSQAFLSGGIGCFGVTPPAARAAVNANATDLATVVALTNQLRAALIATGICV